MTSFGELMYKFIRKNLSLVKHMFNWVWLGQIKFTVVVLSLDWTKCSHDQVELGLY